MGVMELATCKIGRTLAFYFFFWLTNFDFSFKESVKYFVQWLFKKKLPHKVKVFDRTPAQCKVLVVELLLFFENYKLPFQSCLLDAFSLILTVLLLEINQIQVLKNSATEFEI